MVVIGGDSSSVPPELQDLLNALAAVFSEGEAKGDDGESHDGDDTPPEREPEGSEPQGFNPDDYPSEGD